MKLAISVLLTLVAIIHLLPLAGVISSTQIGRAYGIAVSDPNVAILMRHRAVLFGLLGASLLAAAWQPAFHGVGIGLGFISVLAFLLIAWREGGVNTEVQRVVIADYVALGCLLLALAMHVLQK
ncbi:hypothetical protein DFR26_1581 [Paraperlucidibaca baekdonensis]|uniref:Phosphopantetheine adenylyltransferase n=1 Tax=Paraperlucidibaca baekdonensis TaxID=748120 RepID=A0A3E0H3A9_9GAMM|nr:phosphopantetheine adenylyltransferase [Paraperlucidibaca baekdonensis]REH37797.1 hypothetical protein DFR26_1581 [Paraperlucidibaca baekdonensis]